MHIGRKNIDRTYNLVSVEGIVEMAVVTDECDQEVNFQSILQFDKHRSNICVKASRTVGIIKHTFSPKKDAMI